MQQYLKLKFFAVLCILLLIAGSAAAEDTGLLFINSDPLNAEILIDGVPLLQKTPALITDIETGSRIISVRKDGFDPADIKVDIEAGTSSAVSQKLFNGNFIASFPGSNEIILENLGQTLLPESFRMPAGNYSIDKEDDTIVITPLYPKEKLLSAAGIVFTTALIADIIAVGVEMKNEGELLFPHSEMLIAAETFTALTGLTGIGLILDRSRFRKEFRIYKTDAAASIEEADRIFENAQKALTAGKLENALTGFSNIIGNFPDYSGFPESLYKIARIHIISGDTNLAVFELKIIIDNYPDPAVYDRACQTLALLYFNSGEMQNSIDAANRMVFYDPLFSETPSEINSIGMEQVIENWARNPERQAQ
ncbi:MAG: PEGA domain-containing protein [Spirochaetales bacterium]|uniref:PEGA domain-containing protein n=1 Tax=Candidatus Thalassospirochaeta sargassi TaxID=3119039 RepID=A0AAJ1IDF3_9SPIO|nr:PEGA domain-containing protein [Spirochaetales bacterium]